MSADAEPILQPWSPMPGHASPEAAVRAAFAALAAQNWEEFVALVHPFDLARFREQEVERLRLHTKDHDVQGAASPELLGLLFGVTSVEELEATPPEDVLRRWLQPRHPEPPPSADYEPPVRSRDLLGGVQEAPDLWHFVYRLTLQARYGRARLHRETLEVVTSRLGSDGWYVVPNPDFTNNDAARMVIVGDDEPSPGGAA